jgi:hypothetical protein
MNRKKKNILIFGLVFILALVTSAGALAMVSSDYVLAKNSLQGGGSGGAVSSSGEYTLVGSFGGTVQIAAAGGNEKICSGFLCAMDTLMDIVYKLFLPFTAK